MFEKFKSGLMDGWYHMSGDLHSKTDYKSLMSQTSYEVGFKAGEMAFVVYKMFKDKR